MRATLVLEEQNGFFSKRWVVKTSVEFTDEEHAKIKYAKLESAEICTVGNGENRRQITVQDVLVNKGWRSEWTSLMDASKDYRFMEDNFVPTLNAVLSVTNLVGRAPKVFEF